MQAKFANEIACKSMLAVMQVVLNRQRMPIRHIAKTGLPNVQNSAMPGQKTQPAIAELQTRSRHWLQWF